jgi:hypothetical protein
VLPLDHLEVVRRVHVGARLIGERLRPACVGVRDREKAHGRMLGGEPRAQRPDTARADNGDTQLSAFHRSLHVLS